MIHFKNICKTYNLEGKEHPILKNISFSVKDGEYLLITGKSGSGKSTLLNMLTGVDTASSGELFAKKTNILSFDEAQMTDWRGEHIGIIFQFFQLIPTLTVLENLLLPMDLIDIIPKKEREERAAELLKIVGLASHSNKFPSSLSGGEQQRVAIARALSNDARIIVADEPTGNLDSENAEMIFSLLEKLHQSGKTILMVTHEKDFIKGATRKIVIKDGILSQDIEIGVGANEASL